MADQRSGRILVLNPNSSPAVTAGIWAAAAGLGLASATFTVDQLDQAPPVLETVEDDRAVAPLVVDYVARRSQDFGAFVIACHGDPGVSAARGRTRHVFGIGETSMLVACAYARYFGILTLGAELVDLKWDQVRRAELAPRCVGVEATGTGVLHGMQEAVELEPYLGAGRALLHRGAQVLVLGCAGMVTVRDRLAQVLAVPVIEPVAATCLVAASATAVRMGA